MKKTSLTEYNTLSLYSTKYRNWLYKCKKHYLFQLNLGQKYYYKTEDMLFVTDKFLTRIQLMCKRNLNEKLCVLDKTVLFIEYSASYMLEFFKNLRPNLYRNVNMLWNAVQDKSVREEATRLKLRQIRKTLRNIPFI